jgi:hypothetical protein
MNIEERLIAIQKSIEDLKMIFLKNQLNIISEKWIPWSDAKEFFDYGSTQMSVLEKNNELIVTNVGRRKYIHRDSIIKLLEKNIVK